MKHNETFQTIIDWQVEVFGEAEVDRAYERAKEEWAELRDEVHDTDERDYLRLAKEAADVIICLLGFINACGYPDAVQRKMEINRSRKWRTNGDGTGYHIKNTP